MKMRLTLRIAILLLSESASYAQIAQDTMGINYRYKHNYDFVTMPDTIYTFQSEFILPEGFHHADSASLSLFQNYVANFPLWHRFMKVGSFLQKTIYERDQISRPVHLPYNGPAYVDKAIPVRILAEYLHDHNREFDLVVVPNAGDTMTYSKWLFHDITFGPKKAVKFVPTEPKDTTLTEYYTFMRICLENTTFQSLDFNCDSVNINEVMPGDLFVAYSDDGKNGVVYVIMHMVVSNRGEKLYAVATGCKAACDFHIPLFNNDRNNPWISPQQIAELGQEFPKKAFFRFKIH